MNYIGWRLEMRIDPNEREQGEESPTIPRRDDEEDE